MFDMEKNSMEDKQFSTPASMDFDSMEDKQFSTPASMDMDSMEGKLFSTPASLDLNFIPLMEAGELTLPADLEGDGSNELQNVEGALNETETFAPSMEVQAELIREEFLNIPEIQYENWQELTVEERIAAMNKLEERVAEIAHRDPITVATEDLEPPLEGYYSHTEKIMVISEAAVADNSYEAYVNALDTLFHEGRHAYQDYNISVRRVEQSDELVEAWAINQNILGYESGQWPIFRYYGFCRYATQPVELDSRVYAETVIRKLEL